MSNFLNCYGYKPLNIFQLLLLFILLSANSVCLADEAPTKAIGLEKGFDPAVIGRADDGRADSPPGVETLGKQMYRVGAIKVDRARRMITIPGVMLPYENNKAIEFLATMHQGAKSYESVFMLESNAFEFNLACILIGLNSEKSIAPKFHFDPQPVVGDPVSISVYWEKEGNRIEYDAIELLKVGANKPQKPSQWNYTGSMFIEGDRFLAQMDGVLIGLIHDPASIIEHRSGLGLGNWGAVTVDPDVAPKSGQKITLKVKMLD